MEDYITSLLEIKCKPLDENILYTARIKNINLAIEHALPIGLIINEFISNTLKYGMEIDKPCNIDLSMEKHGESNYALIYSDNGPGILTCQNQQTGIGMDLVKSFVEQINGKLITDSTSKGLKYTIDFKI
jgi:two-component sensor histidine kinase